MIDNKKVLLVLGGFAQVCDIVQNAKEKGVYVIATDYLADSPAKKIADESYMISITDVDGIVRLCKERNVDGVMNYCIDPGQKPYQQICERLGLPCYGTKVQFETMTNKDRFKRACLENGLDVIPGLELDETFTEEQLSQLEFPVIVKPADGRASKGVTVCNSKLEIAKAIRYALTFSERKKIVIEKYITGQEVVIKYFAIDGRIFLTSMADLFTCYTETGERAYIGAQTFPSRYYKFFLETTDAKVRRMIKNLGIQNGAMSFDGFVDNGKFRFFDPSFRMGGAQDWRIVAAITGINISDLLTEFALKGKIDYTKNMDALDKGFARKTSAILYFLVRQGKIGRIKGVEQTLDINSVIGYHSYHDEGDTVSKKGTSDHVALRFLIVCDNTEQLKDTISKIQSSIAILDEDGKNMLLPSFDISLLCVN